MISAYQKLELKPLCPEKHSLNQNTADAISQGIRKFDRLHGGAFRELNKDILSIIIDFIKVDCVDFINEFGEYWMVLESYEHMEYNRNSFFYPAQRGRYIVQLEKDFVINFCCIFGSRLKYFHTSNFEMIGVNEIKVDWSKIKITNASYYDPKPPDEWYIKSNNKCISVSIKENLGKKLTITKNLYLSSKNECIQYITSCR